MRGHLTGGGPTLNSRGARGVVAVLGSALGLLGLLAGAEQPPGRPPPAATAAASAPPAVEPEPEESQRKARLLAGDRWRRAMFELDQWLAMQPVYMPAEVRRIRADLAARVTVMPSYELEYLLDSLDAKLRILESPRAREARNWLGRYLAVMAEWRRSDLLEHVPNIVDMSAADLAAALEAVEAKRRAVDRMAREADRGRRNLASFTAAIHDRDTAIRAARARIRRGDVAFSPYRGQPAADPPFADAHDSPAIVGAGMWLTTVGVNVGGF